MAVSGSSAIVSLSRNGRRDPPRVNRCGPCSRDQQNVMHGIMGRLSASAVAGLVLLAAVAVADEKPEKTAPDKRPQKIQDANNGPLPRAQVTSPQKANDDRN